MGNMNMTVVWSHYSEMGMTVCIATLDQILVYLQCHKVVLEHFIVSIHLQRQLQTIDASICHRVRRRLVKTNWWLGINPIGGTSAAPVANARMSSSRRWTSSEDPEGETNFKTPLVSMKTIIISRVNNVAIINCTFNVINRFSPPHQHKFFLLPTIRSIGRQIWLKQWVQLITWHPIGFWPYQKGTELGRRFPQHIQCWR